MALTPPEPLRGDHDRSRFDSGAPDLDEWLRLRAEAAEGLSARTFVLRDDGAVIGYYCLATGGLARKALPNARLHKNQPDPVPVLVLGRLAIDRRYQGRQLGTWLLRDAIRRAIGVSAEVGVRAIVVHALDDRAGALYRKYGFVECSAEPLTMLLPLETALAVFG